MKFLILITGILLATHAMGQQKEKNGLPPQRIDTTKDGIIYNFVEQQPVPGFNYQSYLQKNLHYPDSARMHNTQGRVIVKFVINEDGGVSNVRIMRGLGDGCDEEAARVVSEMRWKPGYQDGKPVKVYFTLPIVFKL